MCVHTVYVSVGNMNISYTSGSTVTLMEDKSGMFLGGAMASLGDSFIVSWLLMSPESLVT